jgi:proton glutamate symport protein
MPANTPSPASNFPAQRWLTAGTLAGLAAGMVLGAWLHQQPDTDPAWLPVVEAIGTAFLRLMRMAVLPLVFCLVVSAVAAGRRGAGVAGARVLAAFALLLGLGGLVAITLTPPLLRLVPSHSLVTSEAPTTRHDAEAGAAAAADRSSDLDPLSALIPDNPFRAAAEGNLGHLIVFAALLGFAVTHLEERRRDLMLDLFRAGADAMLWLVSRVLLVAPVAVFALALQAGRVRGLAVAGTLLHFLVITALVLVVFTVMLYPVGAWAARTSLGAYAAALAPPQAIGLSTRSSLAAIPTVLDSALNRLHLPPQPAALAVSLSGAAFKPHGPVSNTAQLLFLAHVYGIDLGSGDIALFFVMAILLSSTAVGLPDHGGGAGRTLPAYLAVGIPVDGYFLTRSVEGLVDYFKTLANVSGHLTATALSARPPAAPAHPELATEEAPPT